MDEFRFAHSISRCYSTCADTQTPPGHPFPCHPLQVTLPWQGLHWMVPSNPNHSAFRDGPPLPSEQPRHSPNHVRLRNQSSSFSRQVSSRPGCRGSASAAHTPGSSAAHSRVMAKRRRARATNRDWGSHMAGGTGTDRGTDNGTDRGTDRGTDTGTDTGTDDDPGPARPHRECRKGGVATGTKGRGQGARSGSGRWVRDGARDVRGAVAPCPALSRRSRAEGSGPAVERSPCRGRSAARRCFTPCGAAWCHPRSAARPSPAPPWQCACAIPPSRRGALSFLSGCYGYRDPEVPPGAMAAPGPEPAASARGGLAAP